MPPTFIHSKDVQVLVNGFDLTGYFNSLAPSAEIAAHDVTVLGNQSPVYAPGLKSGVVMVDGFFDSTSVVGSDVVLSALLGALVTPLVSIAPKGFTLGNRVYSLQAHEDSYKLAVKVADMVRNSASFKSTDGYDFAVSLHASGVSEIGSGNTASVDNAVLSANGGVAQLHVTAVAGSTPSCTVKVQHSTDNSTWADLVTFVAATATGAQRIAVAPGTTVNRYLRATQSISGGSPSFTYQLSFARR